ncbi:unnamed protein product [Spirodela intermedia]|uniref:Uncharacterized protein n=1 Tax=Spirodela intermedia TaxID=51605 RepID=A0A7I8KSL7_SPIIN|nr:unnamed protein product [Spirodela intermedia]
MSSALPPENIRDFLILDTEIRTFVTNRAEEADQWVREQDEPVRPWRSIGLSFFWEACSLPDGSITLRVDSIHISFLTDVLVYHLGSTPNAIRSSRLADFLRDHRNIFVGEDIRICMWALGFRSLRRHNLMSELTDVAHFYGLSSGAILGGPYPFHVSLAAVILSNEDEGLLLLADLQRFLPCNWPMSNIQIALAAQTAFVNQLLGINFHPLALG